MFSSYTASMRKSGWFGHFLVVALRFHLAGDSSPFSPCNCGLARFKPLRAHSWRLLCWRCQKVSETLPCLLLGQAVLCLLPWRPLSGDTHTHMERIKFHCGPFKGNSVKWFARALWDSDCLQLPSGIQQLPETCTRILPPRSSGVRGFKVLLALLVSKTSFSCLRALNVRASRGIQGGERERERERTKQERERERDIYIYI